MNRTTPQPLGSMNEARCASMKSRVSSREGVSLGLWSSSSSVAVGLVVGHAPNHGAATRPRQQPPRCSSNAALALGRAPENLGESAHEGRFLALLGGVPPRIRGGSESNRRCFRMNACTAPSTPHGPPSFCTNPKPRPFGRRKTLLLPGTVEVVHAAVAEEELAHSPRIFDRDRGRTRPSGSSVHDR